MKSLFAVALSSLALSCGSSSPPPPTPAPAEEAQRADGDHGPSAPAAPTRIVFQFHDSSVPPPYHRSYTVTATPTEIRKVVDSYGDVISDTKAPLTADQYAAIVAALATHGLGPKAAAPAASEPAAGCTGGTGHSLVLARADGTESRLHVAHCGGADSGTLAGDVEAFATVLSSYLPSPLRGSGPGGD